MIVIFFFNFKVVILFVSVAVVASYCESKANNGNSRIKKYEY